METAHSRPRITALTYPGRMSILESASKGTVKHWLRSNTLKMGSILPEYMLYTELESCMGVGDALQSLPPSSTTPLSSCRESFSASGSFPMNQLFASCGRSIGASASGSVFPLNIQG